MSNYRDISDSQLITLYKENHNKEIVGELYKRYTKFVFLISMKYLKNEEQSKDSVMLIFEKLFTDLSNHQIDNFKSWLYMVTRNHCLMYLRKEQSDFKKTQDLKKDYENFMENDLNSHLIENETEEVKIESIHDAVSQLNKEQKECVKLFYMEGKSYSEIADLTNYPIKKVKSSIQNGKRNLKIILTKAGISALIVIYVIIT